VVVVGDSLSKAVQWREVFPELNITSRAASGSTVKDLLARRDEVVELTPSTILLLVGINDLRWNVPPDRFLSDLKSYIELCRAQARVVVQSVLPARDPERWPGINRKVRLVNDALSSWCRQTGVTFVDLRPALAPQGYLAEEFSTDGIHLTGRGIGRWMEVLKEYGVLVPSSVQSNTTE
jgi:lysophospholipase L1-like esterase